MTTLRHFSAYKGELTSLYGLMPGQLFLDLTLGDGGHTQEALEAGCRVVSFDIDPQAIQRATQFVTRFTPLIIENWESEVTPKEFQWIIINSNFILVTEVVTKLKLPKFDGIMVDLGPSQFQILSKGRGFSFATDEPLDMRLDQSLGVTAADLLAVLNEGELGDLFQLADESYGRQIARAIVKQRQITPVTTTKQLADLVLRIKKSSSSYKIHPATKTFMALRMAVNLERENIRLLLPQLPALVKPGGIIGIISFHSGEDRIVKQFVQSCVNQGIASAINKKPIEPSINELQISPRTRSAKLRLIKTNA